MRLVLQKGGMQWAQWAAMPPSSATGESAPCVKPLCAPALPLQEPGCQMQEDNSSFSLLLTFSLSYIKSSPRLVTTPTVLPKGQVGVVPCKVSGSILRVSLLFMPDTPAPLSSPELCVCLTV